MTRLRLFLLAALLVLAASPVPRLYTAGPPMIDKMHVLFNDLRGLEGEGLPGSPLSVRYRQRNFREGTASDSNDPFQWCAWKNGGNSIHLGTTTVGPNGRWALNNLDLSLFPSIPNGDACGSGLKTEILIDSPYSPGSVPVASWLNVNRPTANVATVQGALEFADRAAIAVADGPDDGDTQFPRDVDEDGADLCAIGIGCGRKVTWRCNGGTFQCPQTTVFDGSTLTSADLEYPFVVGLLSGHKPGGSVVMAAEINRPALGPTLNLNVNIGGLPACDGNFFDFLG